MAYDNGFLNAGLVAGRTRTAPKTFASGKHAIAVCDRCGWKYAWSALRTEPGTLLKVCRSCNDGQWSLVTHPQNYIATNVVDAIALRWARPDLAVSPNSVDKTPPYYLVTEDNYLIEFAQGTIIIIGTSAGTPHWSSPPFGYGPTPNDLTAYDE